MIKMVFLGGDFNAHIWKEVNNYNFFHGCCGFGVRNKSGQNSLKFAIAKSWLL